MRSPAISVLHRRLTLSTLALAAAVGLLAGSGCGGLDPYKIAERSVRRYLADYLGPARNYRVRIDRQDTRLTGGYLSRLDISAEGLRTKGGFEIESAEAELHGVRFDRKTRSLQSVESSAFTATVTHAGANAYLAAHDRGINGLSVEFEEGEIIVHAAPKVLGIAIPVTLRGRGAPDGESKIRFLTDGLAVSRLNLPEPAVRFVERRINPVFDLDELQLPVKLRKVESRKGTLILSGEVKLPIR